MGRNSDRRVQARRVALRALARYPITPRRVRLQHAGYNVTYRVFADEGVFALRVTRPGPTAAHVAAEVAWMHALQTETTLRVPGIMRTIDGQQVVEINGQCCVLARWLDGAMRAKGLTPNMLAAVGEALAQLHAHGEAWRPPEGWSRPQFDGVWLRAPDPTPGLPPETRDLFLEAADRVAPVLAAQRALPRHVIHADLHQGNYRFARGHDVGLIDFDDCAIGTPAQDVAITLYYLQSLPQFDALWAALRRGYTRRRPWPTDPETTRVLMVWRTLHLCSDCAAHPSAEVRAFVERMIPKWTARIQRFMADE